MKWPGIKVKFEPPFPVELAPGDEDYAGMFLNEHGEPMVFVGKRDGTAYVVHGDSLAADGNPYPVVDGRVPELILSPTEAAWVQVCWDSSWYLRR